MRPRRYYAVFANGEVIAITFGAAEARKITKCRAYKAFKTQLAAEEFAAWWNQLGADRFLEEASSRT